MGGVRGRSLREKLVTGGVGLKYVVWDRWFELWLRVVWLVGCVWHMWESIWEELWVWGEVEEHKGVFTIFPFIPWYVCDFLVWKSPKRPIYYHFTVCFIVIFM